MKTWLFPDGFIGDDPSSKGNACWLGAMIGFYVLIAFLLAG
jgi:hypothetical protein